LELIAHCLSPLGGAVALRQPNRYIRAVQSSTLNPGSRAPDFSLSAANRPGTFTLAQFLENGPAVLEFLRGTW
jgi:hypothetical protein